MTDKYYTLTELEKIIGVTHVTLLRYVKEGKLKAVKLCGKWRVTQEEVNRFLQG